MPYHPVVKQITELLEANHCPFETFEHEPVRTSEDAAKLRHGFTLHQGAKALIVKIESRRKLTQYLMLVFPADLKFDAKKVKTLLDARSVNFATEEEVAALSGGVQVGGVPPFGNLFNLEIYADRTLFANEKIVFNAGDRSFSVAMRSEDYRRVVQPNIAEIV